MSGFRLIVLALVLSAGCLTTRASWAQRAQRSDSLPRELVTALLGGTMGMRQIDIQAGMGDEAIPAEVFRDALVLGYGAFPAMKMTVAYFPYGPQETIDTIRTRMIQAGWRAAVNRHNTERGFVSSSSYFSSTTALCGERSVVVPTVNIRTLSRTLAVLANQTSQSSSDYLCGERAQRRTSPRDEIADSPLPALAPPAGMQSRSAGMSSADGAQWELRTSLTGKMPLAEVLRSYAAQMVAAKWTQGEEVVATNAGMILFDITDAAGQAWHCILSATLPPKGEEMWLRLTLQRL